VPIEPIGYGDVGARAISLIGRKASCADRQAPDLERGSRRAIASRWLTDGPEYERVICAKPRTASWLCLAPERHSAVDGLRLRPAPHAFRRRPLPHREGRAIVIGTGKRRGEGPATVTSFDIRVGFGGRKDGRARLELVLSTSRPSRQPRSPGYRPGPMLFRISSVRRSVPPVPPKLLTLKDWAAHKAYVTANDRAKAREYWPCSQRGDLEALDALIRSTARPSRHVAAAVLDSRRAQRVRPPKATRDHRRVKRIPPLWREMNRTRPSRPAFEWACRRCGKRD